MWMTAFYAHKYKIIQASLYFQLEGLKHIRQD